jgi:ribonuclease P protein component
VTLPKKSRLVNKKEIRQVFGARKAVRGSFLLVRMLSGPTFKGAVLVPSKIGTAVRRNKIKRILLEFLRKKERLIDGYVVISVQKTIRPEEEGLVLKELSELLLKINV